MKKLTLGQIMKGKKLPVKIKHRALDAEWIELIAEWKNGFTGKNSKGESHAITKAVKGCYLEGEEDPYAR